MGIIEITLLFLALVTARPSGLPSCPTGTHYDPSVKACVQNIDDRDIARGEPAAPQPIETVPCPWEK